MKISVIVPFLNERENLGRLFPYLQSIISKDITELIFVDGGSEDDGFDFLVASGAKVFLSPKRGRACQMNFGAKQASGVIFYFLHADVLPHASFEKILLNAWEKGVFAGCFRYSFDSNKAILKLNNWFTRFKNPIIGGGDQSLYILQEKFDELNGFDERFCIMEDFEFVGRLRKVHDFHIFDEEIRVSARKYEKNSWLKVQYANFLAFFYFRTNESPEKIKSIYQSLLK